MIECKNIKKLRFDFYLPNINICIEYQGEFHYKTIEGISKINSLTTQIKCDNIKKEYCKNNNIELIEIPYWDFKNIETILNNILSKKTNYLEN